MYASMDFEDVDESGSDSLWGTLLLLRAAYNFDSGVFLGFDIQLTLLFSSSEGDRQEKLRRDGVANASADASVAAFLVGYSLARAFQMSPEVWARHANPLSVWTRYAALPVLIFAIWSRAWIGWWSVLPVLAVLVGIASVGV